MDMQEIGAGYFAIDMNHQGRPIQIILTDERIGYLLDPIQSKVVEAEIKHRYSLRRQRITRYTDGR